MRWEMNSRINNCIEVNGIMYPRNFTIQQMMICNAEAENLTDDEEAIALFCLEAFSQYVHLDFSQVSELKNMNIGSNLEVHVEDDGYIVHRFSEHLYNAEILQLEVQYEENTQYNSEFLYN